MLFKVTKFVENRHETMTTINIARMITSIMVFDTNRLLIMFEHGDAELWRWKLGSLYRTISE
jgi:hypothetical protein